jgi:ABC-type Fe3+/spermidine/putrescine transport system ATPase subunit
MPAIELKGVSKFYGKLAAVDHVDLRIEEGEYITILGPSGCGKTTLIRMIAGIITPTDGVVTIGGKDMNGVPIEDRDIGYVFQNIALFPNLTVQDNVSYSPRVMGKETEEQNSIALKYLELVKLLDKMEMFPHELCGGEQQKVSLARALATGSKVILLDEPLSALDARVRVDLRYDLRRLVKSLGITTVHVTHDQEEAMSVSDRIVLMKKGSVVEIGTPEQLYTKPMKIFTANFIGETNLLEGWIKSVSDGITRIELRDDSLVEVLNATMRPGDPVVVSVRPEFVFPYTSGLHATITTITYMGTYWHIQAMADSQDRMDFDVPTSDGNLYHIGQEIYLMINKKAAVVYPRPIEGIAEAVKLE